LIPKVLSCEAKPGPAIGQSLGPLGLNMAEFCKQFNAKTSKMKPGIPVPVRLTAYKDRTFDFYTLTPPTTWFLKKCANIEKGSARPLFDMVGKVTVKQVYEIAKIKQADLQLRDTPLEHLCRSIAGSARSMGIEIIEGRQKEGEVAKVPTTAAEAKDSSKSAAAKPASLAAAKAPAAKSAAPAAAAKDSKAVPADKPAAGAAKLDNKAKPK